MTVSMHAPAAGAVAQRVGTVFAIPIHLVCRNPRNPRKHMGDLTELTASIREVGILQPLLASRNKNGRITLIAGHRRLDAAELAGLTHVPVILAGDMRPDLSLQRAVIENLHRARIAPMDEARACDGLRGDGYSQERIARSLGRSTAWVADRFALLDLPRTIQDQVDARTMSIADAVALSRQVRRTGRGSITQGARCVSHFTKVHPLRETAQQRCDAAGHPKAGRTGGVCGACWEAEIRADALAQAGVPVLAGVSAA